MEADTSTLKVEWVALLEPTVTHAAKASCETRSDRREALNQFSHTDPAIGTVQKSLAKYIAQKPSRLINLANRGSFRSGIIRGSTFK